MHSDDARMKDKREYHTKGSLTIHLLCRLSLESYIYSSYVLVH